MPTKTRDFRAPDGSSWSVEIRTPGTSTALIVFRPVSGVDGSDRYTNYIAPDGERSGVMGRLDAAVVLDAIDERAIAKAFRVSVPVNARRSPLDYLGTP
jgi:hypothetical protein